MVSTRLVLRLLLAGIGLVYVVAFLSLWVQVLGLVGAGGILPNQRFFAALAEHSAASFVDVPSVCWGGGCSDAMLVALCGVGTVAGVLLVLGRASLPAALLAWAAYLSLFNAGQMFMYNFVLAGVAIGLTLLYVSLTTTCNWLKLRLQRVEMMERGRITGLTLQLITGVAKLRVTGAEDHAFRAWATEFAGMRQTAFKVGRIGNFMPILNASVNYYA